MHKNALYAIIYQVSSLMQNGYPSKFIENAFSNFLIRSVPSHNKRIHTTVTRLAIFLLFKLPYLGSITHHIEKELHQHTKTNIPNSKFRCIHTTNKFKKHFYTKDS